jgi:hypothetical protein
MTPKGAPMNQRCQRQTVLAIAAALAAFIVGFANAQPAKSVKLNVPFTPGPIAINHHLYKSLTFDPTKWIPPATPKHVVDYAHKQFSAAVAAPDVIQKFLGQGVVPGGASPEKTADSSAPKVTAGARSSRART